MYEASLFAVLLDSLLLTKSKTVPMMLMPRGWVPLEVSAVVFDSLGIPHEINMTCEQSKCNWFDKNENLIHTCMCFYQNNIQTLLQS